MSYLHSRRSERKSRSNRSRNAFRNDEPHTEVALEELGIFAEIIFHASISGAGKSEWTGTMKYLMYHSTGIPVAIQYIIPIEMMNHIVSLL